MIYGQAWTVPYGDPADFLLDYQVLDNGSGGVDITASAATGYGNLWWLLIVDGTVQATVFLAEGATKRFSGVYDSARTTHAVSLYCLGEWTSPADVDPFMTQTYFTTDKGQFVQLDFDGVMVPTEADNDLDQFSAWALAGLARFSNCETAARLTQARLEIVLATVGGVHTLTLYMGTVAIASGSRSGNGTITLTALNGSGVTGSVSLAYSADLPAASVAYVCARWATSYTVTVGGVAATVYDPGRGTRFSAVVGPLAAGSQAYSVLGISDTGITGSAATGTITVPGRPEAPGELNVTFTGAWNNTVVSFAASATAGATYALYQSGALDGPINHDDIAATHAAGSGVIAWTIPNLAGAAAGTRRVMIVAVNGGVEDAARRVINIEYDASGNIVSLRPNAPGFALRATSPATGGLTVNVTYVYDAANQAGLATLVKLYVVKEPYSSIGAGETPVALAAAINGISRGVLSKAVAGAGWYKVLVRASTSAGTLSNNATLSPQIYLSDAVPAAPGNVAASVVG